MSARYLRTVSSMILRSCENSNVKSDGGAVNRLYISRQPGCRSSLQAASTIAGGFFVVVPVMLGILILGETFDMIVAIADPIADLLPIAGLDAGTEKTLVAIVLIVVLCLVTGLVMRTDTGARLGRWFEGLVLERIPGYRPLKSMSRRFAGDDGDLRFAPAVLTTALQTRVLAFVVEEHENGDVIVFIPSAPTPVVGMIHIVRKEQIRKLDAPMATVFNCFSEFGAGAGNLIALGPEAAQASEP